MTSRPVCRTAWAEEENRRASPRNAHTTAATSGPDTEQLLLQRLAGGLAAGEQSRSARGRARARPPGPPSGAAPRRRPAPPPVTGRCPRRLPARPAPRRRLSRCAMPGTPWWNKRGMDPLRPGGVLLGQVPVQLQQRPQLHGLLRRDPRQRHLALGDQGPQMAGIGLIGLGPLLRAALVRGLGRLGEQRGDPRPLQLLHHEQPPRAALHRERHILAAGEPAQPRPQLLAARRVDPAPPHLPGHGV